MRLLWLALPSTIVSLGCRPGIEVRPPVAAACSESRIGAVAIAGAGARDVPGLAILEGTLDDPARTRRVAAAALDGLRWRGYAQAELSIARREASETGCFVELTVAVALGPRFTIAGIRFETADDFPARERLAVIEDALGTVNAPGGVYIDYRLRRALAGLERRYHDAGWLDAKIGAPSTEYGEDGAVRVAIPVEAGRRYRIGTIRARGANELARRAVLDELGIDPGAFYDGPALRQGIDRARRKLDRRVELRTTLTAGDEIEIEAIVERRP